MVEIKFLGGCRTIGGTSVAINSKNGTILLDYGMIMERPPKFPLSISPKDLKIIALSHCHADHSCGIPLLYSGVATPKLLTTAPTLDLTRIVILDTLKISKYFLPYEKFELMRMIKNTETIGYNKVKLRNGISITFFNAGHIPGSASILVEIEGKRILFTGDTNLIQTQLVNHAHLNFPSLDYVIIESTYALQDHPDRLQTEEEFMQEVLQRIENDGVVLVPAFGVARSQEILLVLKKYNFKYPIYIDGMARTTSYIIRDHPNFIRDYSFYKSALKKAKFISFKRKKEKERLQAMSKPGVIIAPSGMLLGGTSRMYLENLANNENNGIFLVSFQIPETPGRILLDTGYYMTKDNHEKIKVDAKLKLFNFSSHSDKTHLFKLLDALNLNPNAKIFCIHGEENACVGFAREINEKLSVEAFAPKNEEIY